VWDHCPGDREILDRRLGEGWRPTASQLRDGDEVQGFAACVFDRTDHSC